MAVTRGTRVGDFVLERPLGEGSSGAVWRAREEDTGQPAAVKLFRPREGIVERVWEEARTLASLQHPHIIAFFDHGVLGDSPWIAMELAGGGSLATMRGRLPWVDLRRVLAELLLALSHAHERGVLHLDLKPSNVLLADGNLAVRLSDFGLAQFGGHSAHWVAGTPAYMAPEQFEARELGPHTDLYGLGALAWDLVVGRAPFGEQDLVACMSGHLLRPPPHLPNRAGVPQAFDTWVQRLLSKDPAQRFPDAMEAGRALAALGA